MREVGTIKVDGISVRKALDQARDTLDCFGADLSRRWVKMCQEDVNRLNKELHGTEPVQTTQYNSMQILTKKYSIFNEISFGYDADRRENRGRRESDKTKVFINSPWSDHNPYTIGCADESP